MEISRTAEKQLQKQRTIFHFLFGITEQLAGRKQYHKSVPFIQKSVRPPRWPDNVLRQRRVTQGAAGKCICLFVFIHTFRPADCLPSQRSPTCNRSVPSLCFKRQYQYAQPHYRLSVRPRPPVSRWLHPASGASVPVLPRKSRCCLWRCEPDHYRRKISLFRTLFSDGFRYHIVKTSC